MKYLSPVLRAVLIVMVFAMASGAATAQDFPRKPVRIVVPYPAGGLTDVLVRNIADGLTKAWGQPVLVDNKPGANTIIAADFVAKSPADGYTLLLATDATVSMNQHLFSKLPYDPVKDFEPVIGMVKTMAFLITPSSLPVNNLPDLVRYAKANPGKLNYGTFGPGSQAHIDGETFSKIAGVSMTPIPYKGVADVLSGMMGGQVQVMFSSIGSALPGIKAGRLKALAVDAPQRWSPLADVPTFAQQDFPTFRSRGWFGFVAPAGTPKAVVDKIAQSVSAIISARDFEAAQIREMGLEPQVMQPAQFAQFLVTDREFYSRELKGVKLVD